jgi:hydroxyacylglutathione hydrolase
MSVVIEILPAFADNYIYLLGDPERGVAMVVDPGDADVVQRVLKKRDWHLTLILNTHHHNDHIGGNAALKKAYGAAVIGPQAESAKIGNLDRAVHDGDVVSFGELRGTVMSVSGHTAGHIAFHFPTLPALFCGDTLFSLGCGRLFEGTAAQMWHSLQKIRALPPETKLYCGHEYTVSSAKFALMLEPDNQHLQHKLQQVQNLRQADKPTLPALLGEECRLNPFLRVDQADFQNSLIRQGLPLAGADPAVVFAAIRTAKDRFQ